MMARRHGFRATYNAGCRCKECRAASRIRNIRRNTDERRSQKRVSDSEYRDRKRNSEVRKWAIKEGHLLPHEKKGRLPDFVKEAYGKAHAR